MELQLEHVFSMKSEGKVSIILPDYMTSLSKETLATSENSFDRLIVAAGRHPSGDILFMTASGCLYEVRYSEYDLLSGSCVPSPRGDSVRICCNRDEILEIGIDWLIVNSRFLIRLTDVSLDDDTNKRG